MLSGTKLFGIGTSLLCLVLGAVSAQLTQPRTVGTNSFEFELNCESNLTYAIQASTNLTSWTTRMRSKGTETTRRIDIDFESSYFPQRAFFRAVQTNEPMFAFALAARETIDFGTNSVEVDSFDSGDPAYSTSGYYDPSKARDRGDLAAEGSESNAIAIGNGTVRGRVRTGQGGSIVVGPNGVVGSWAFTASAANMGKIQPGWFTDDATNLFDPVILPPGSESWLPFPEPTDIAIDDVTYKYSLPSGDYRTTTLSNKGSIYFVGNVRLRVDGTLLISGEQGFRVQTNSTLTIYMNGADATFGGQGINNPNRATNFLYFGTSRNVALVIGGNWETVGAFYAPHAHLLFAGETNRWSDFMGSCFGRSVRFQNRLRLHFDEDLLRKGPWR